MEILKGILGEKNKNKNKKESWVKLPKVWKETKKATQLVWRVALPSATMDTEKDQLKMILRK